MAANVRQRSRINWPRVLREPRPGYFTWEPPADVIPLLDSAPPTGGFVLGRLTLQQAIAQVTEAYLHTMHNQEGSEFSLKINAVNLFFALLKRRQNGLIRLI